MSETTWLTKKDLENVPQELLPMPVFSDRLRSFYSWGIKHHEKGYYNHFMWLIHPGVVASQSWIYHIAPISDYADECRLKLWQSTAWTAAERDYIIKTIERELSKPWYNRLYDVPAIVGQLIWHNFQTPGLSICSDHGAAMKDVEPCYDLRFPGPQDVNEWLSDHHDRFQVYGRYTPD